MEENSLAYRPMTAGNILDYTFQIYGRNFGAILSFSVLVAGLFNLLYLLAIDAIALPGMMVNPWQSIFEALETGNIDDIFKQAETEITDFQTRGFMAKYYMFQGVSLLMGILSGIFINPFIQGGIMGIANEYIRGNKPSISSAFHLTLKKFWRLVVTSLCITLYYLGIGIAVFIITFICIIPLITFGILMGNTPSIASMAGFTVMLIFVILLIIFIVLIAQIFISFSYPVVMAENVFNFSALGRSFKLVGKKFWKVLGITLLIVFITGIMTLILGISAFVLMMVTRSPMAAQYFVSLFNTALIMPIGYIATTVLYLDVRRQVEG